MSAVTTLEHSVSGETAVRPFQVSFAEAELAELRRRVSATRWPERETVNDDSQGVPLALMQELARYWATDYDSRQNVTGRRRRRAARIFEPRQPLAPISRIHVK
jgi:hypothetical protein